MNQKTAAETLSVLTLLEKLKITIDSITRATIHDKGVYGCALRASIAKSFEFTCLAYQDPPPTHGFFITATLRGICEDLITFTFLETLSEDERNDALSLLMSTNIAEGLNAQSEFFSLNRPWQPVVQPPKLKKADTEKKLRALSAKLGWTGRQAWPTVWYMAKAANLHALYNYLYSATSKWVHFSPHILLRMGWGRLKRRCWRSYRVDVYNNELFPILYRVQSSLFAHATFKVSSWTGGVTTTCYYTKTY